jgi:hypothetical protein
MPGAWASLQGVLGVTKPVWIKWCPKDALDGMNTLGPWEELAYRRILDLIYSTGDNLPDDDRKLGWMTKTGSRWPAIKNALIDAGKIKIVDRSITATLHFPSIGRPSPSVWQKLRSLVFERDGNACVYCGFAEHLECDHVVPVSAGGAHHLGNLATACRRCNRSKAAKLIGQWMGVENG